MVLYELDPPADDWASQSEHLVLTERWLCETFGLGVDQAVTITSKLIAAGWLVSELAVAADGSTVYTRAGALTGDGPGGLAGVL